MFIRVTTGTFDLSREADVQRWAEEQFLPALRQLPGFVEYRGSFDRDTGRLAAISLWETREQADALRERTAAVVGQLAAIGVQLETAQVFEETVRS